MSWTVRLEGAAAGPGVRLLGVVFERTDAAAGPGALSAYVAAEHLGRVSEAVLQDLLEDRLEAARRSRSGARSGSRRSG